MTTAQRIRSLLVKTFQLDAERLTPEAQLQDLGIDSIGVAELLFDLEDEFGLKLPNEMAPLLTLGDVTAYIDRLVALKGAAASGAGLAGVAALRATP